MKKSKTSQMPPLSLTILGKPYSVRFTTGELSGEAILGSANRTKATIVLRNDIAPAQIRETLLHEVIHMIDQELLLGLEEADVCRLSVGLFSAGVEIAAFKDIERAAGKR